MEEVKVPEKRKVGRPTVLVKKERKPVFVYVSPELHASIVSWCAESGQTLSEAVRRALQDRFGK